MAFAAADCTNARSLCGRYGVTDIPHFVVSQECGRITIGTIFGFTKRYRNDKISWKTFRVWGGSNGRSLRTIILRRKCQEEWKCGYRSRYCDECCGCRHHDSYSSRCLQYVFGTQSLFSVSSYSRERTRLQENINHRSTSHSCLHFTWPLRLFPASTVRWLRQCLLLGVTTNRCCLLTRALNFLVRAPFWLTPCSTWLQVRGGTADFVAKTQWITKMVATAVGDALGISKKSSGWVASGGVRTRTFRSVLSCWVSPCAGRKKKKRHCNCTIMYK